MLESNLILVLNIFFMPLMTTCICVLVGDKKRLQSFLDIFTLFSAFVLIRLISFTLNIDKHLSLLVYIPMLFTSVGLYAFFSQKLKKISGFLLFPLFFLCFAMAFIIKKTWMFFSGQ